MFNVKEKAVQVRELGKQMLDAMTDEELLDLAFSESPSASVIADKIRLITKEARRAQESGQLVY